MGVSCEKSKVGKCDFCENDLVGQEYTNVHKVHGRFCSIGCEFALVLEQDLFMIGSSSELIPHLRACLKIQFDYTIGIGLMYLN